MAATNVNSNLNIGTGMVDVYEIKQADFESQIKNKDIGFLKKNVYLMEDDGGKRKKVKADVNLLFGEDGYELLNMGKKNDRYEKEKKIGIMTTTTIDGSMWGKSISDVMKEVFKIQKIKIAIKEPKLEIFAFASTDFFVYDCEKKFGGFFPENSLINPDRYSFEDELTNKEFFGEKSLLKYKDKNGNYFTKFSIKGETKYEKLKVLKPFVESNKRLIKSIKKGDRIKIYYKDILDLNKVYFITEEERNNDATGNKSGDWGLKKERVKGENIFNYIDKKFEVEAYFYGYYSYFTDSLVAKDISILYENEWNKQSLKFISDFEVVRPEWKSVTALLKPYVGEINKSKRLKMRLNYLKIFNKSYKTMIVLRKIIWEFFKKKYNVSLVQKYFKLLVSFIRNVSKLNKDYNELKNNYNKIGFDALVEDVNKVAYNDEEKKYRDYVIYEPNPFSINEYHQVDGKSDDFISTDDKNKTKFNFVEMEKTKKMNKIMIEFLTKSNEFVGKGYGKKYTSLDRTLKFVEELGEFKLIMEWKDFDKKKSELDKKKDIEKERIMLLKSEALLSTFSNNKRIIKNCLQIFVNEYNAVNQMNKIKLETLNNNELVVFLDEIFKFKRLVFSKIDKNGMLEQMPNILGYLDFLFFGNTMGLNKDQLTAVGYVTAYGNDQKTKIFNSGLLPYELTGSEQYTNIVNLFSESMDEGIVKYLEIIKQINNSMVNLKVLNVADNNNNAQKNLQNQVAGGVGGNGVDPNKDKRLDEEETKRLVAQDQAKLAVKTELINKLINIYNDYNDKKFGEKVTKEEMKPLIDSLDVLYISVLEHNLKEPINNHLLNSQLITDYIKFLNETGTFRKKATVINNFAKMLDEWENKKK